MKQLYYKETPIEIGQIINVNDINVLVNESLIENNPLSFTYKLNIEYVKLVKEWSVAGEFAGEIFELSTLDNLDKFKNAPTKEFFRKQIEGWINRGYFKIATKEDFVKQELIREAIKRGFDKCPKYLIFPWQTNLVKLQATWSTDTGFIFPKSDKDLQYKGVRIYYKGEWAKIVEPLLTTDDNVDLFIGDTMWIVSKKDYSYSSMILIDDPNFGKLYFRRSEFMYFSTEDLVHKYIKKNKLTTLQDYEKLLLEKDMILNNGFYTWMKCMEPKLYYSKVLELIADDLNGKSQKELKENHERDYYNINLNGIFELSVDNYNIINRGYILFESKKSAEQALLLMGPKLDCIYK